MSQLLSKKNFLKNISPAIKNEYYHIDKTQLIFQSKSRNYVAISFLFIKKICNLFIFLRVF